LQRLGQVGGVVAAERLAVPRTVALRFQDLADQHLATALLVVQLDLHTASLLGTCGRPRDRTIVSATSKGLTGFTNHASAPDHAASHASCRRSSRISTRPGNGG